MNKIYSKYIYILSIGSLCSFATLLSAAPTLQYSKTYQSCINTAKTTGNKQLCISAEHLRQNERLNQAVKKLTSKLSTYEQSRLSDAQVEWQSLQNFKDDQCDQAAFDDENAAKSSGKNMTALDCDRQSLECVAERAHELEQGNVRAEYYLDP